MNALIQELNARVVAAEGDILRFFREIVAIPSMDSDIEEVGRRVGAEMEQLGFGQVHVDRYGSIVGRIGSGPTTLLYDSHLDTVGIGDPAQWPWDPFEGKIEDGLFYARGALDEKGSTPGMVYGLAMARDLGLLDGYTAYYLGNVEEWCDGIACQAFVEWEGVRPDYVVIGEPTNMKVYRGHKGRIELEITAKGKSAHAASNQLGDNAIYKMLPLIAGIRDLNDRLPSHDFLGQGRITVTRVSSVSPSDNAVPDECRIFVDRRVTFGETRDGVVQAIRELVPSTQQDGFQVHELVHSQPSYTGAVFIYEKYFPAWALEESDPFVQAGQATIETLWGRREPAGKWDFSTNGNYWRGKAGIPSIGFGPGDEIYAHAVNEHVPLADVVEATKFYALLPHFLKEEIRD
ncbi:MAG: YgeY family selenium metabolism-linked hydrolase [Chloroflexi bacterium]|nr:YgeY family selenium metabolism-linked hydrolase [Chloroflexota bacterium]MCI0574610.1 YgeY family selenium metabolism-linked hydrolase [Chloroflexota bacterium]MCI0644038.1 YgeY family selenium metabolism-linked hydrolase [Chloroflexota bacterium]MCI0731712.1 YgeY family selenium metabolism-linked hydrolase [Chloroflexota bacterium]